MLIVSESHAGRSHATALIHEGANHMVQEGTAPITGLVFPVKPDDGVLYARSEQGDIVGVLCYRRQADTWEITLGYVEPSSRRAKVMTRLWREFQSLAHTAGMRTVLISVQAQNEAANMFVAKHVGTPDVTLYAFGV